MFDDPSLLTSFAILAFSDLKNYKFYYWFAFPALSVDWKLNGSIRTVEKEEKGGICEAVDRWRETVGAREWGFFLLKQDEAGGWVAGSLMEYKTFWNDSKSQKKIFGFNDPSTIADVPGWPLRNYMYMLSMLNIDDCTVLAYRDHLSTDVCRSLWLDVSIARSGEDKVIGWERNSNGKLAPKFSDLGSLINPRQLADQAVDLNLKLMKWRIAPSVDLDVIKSNSCLLLGAGTLGSYVSRALLGWGVRKITFVDSGKVSYSNPVRQSLYKFEDCKDGGVPKAERAAEALKEIYPSVEAEGHKLDIPMLGHPLTNEPQQREDYNKLLSLIDQHDTVFLLMDSRESRWLPTLIGCCKQKLVINVALGFDSYVVLRHGVMDPKNNNQPHLGCYFCNDVVAPIDSVSNQTLDQMCTVTRPGVSMLASSSAVELFSSILQHPLKALAPANETSTNSLSDLPHQLRGFLHNFETMKIWGPSYSCCSACSPPITAAWNTDGWEFVKRALNEPGYVEELSGLAEVQRKADQLDIDTDWAASDNSEELL